MTSSRGRGACLYLELQTVGYTVILQITSADQSHAPLGLSSFTSVHLSFAYVEFLRLTLPDRQFLKPDKGGRRKQDTAVELWCPCWFPKIQTCWKRPQAPRLGGLQPKSSFNWEFYSSMTLWLQSTEVFRRSDLLGNLGGLACTTEACVEDARLCLFEFNYTFVWGPPQVMILG